MSSINLVYKGTVPSVLHLMLTYVSVSPHLFPVIPYLYSVSFLWAIIGSYTLCLPANCVSKCTLLFAVHV